MGGRQHVILGLAAVLTVAAGALVWLGVPDPVYLDGGNVGGSSSQAHPNTSSVLASGGTSPSKDTDADSRPVKDRTRLAPDEARWTVRLRAFRGRDQRFAGARLRVTLYPGFEAAGDALHVRVLTTNDKGEATWRLPTPAQTVTVQVQSADPEIVAMGSVSVVPVGEAAPLVQVHLFPLDHVLLGVVTNLEGKPVPKARVSWSRSLPPTHTDEQGRFRLRLSSLYRALRYHVVAPGYSRFSEVLYLDGPGTSEVEVRLKPGFRVFGRVTDSDGRPLEGVEVSTFWVRYTGERTFTDAEGNYQLDTLAIDRDRHYVVATLKGYARTQASTKSPGPKARLDVTMKRAATITGTVFGPDGRPVAGAKVGLSRHSRPSRSQTVVTHKDGRFTLEHRGDRRLYLWTHKRGFAIDRRRIDAVGEGSAMDLQIHLQEGHFVAGRVTDDEGQPVASARVSAFLEGRGSVWLGISELTDAQGRFRLEDLPGQEQQKLFLWVSAPGFLTLQHRDLALDREDVDIVLQRSVVLRGRVVDGRTGAPLQDFRIRVLKRSWGGVGMPWLGKGQRFQNTDGYWETTKQRIKAGTSFDLEAIADGYAPTVLKQVVATPDMTPEAALFKMFPGVILTGQVLDQATGVPVAGAKLTLIRPNQRAGRPELGGEHSRRSSADGSFRFEHVAPGPLLLKVDYKGRPPFLHGPLTVPTTGTMDHVSILLGSAGRIEGVLADPHANVKVYLAPDTMGRRQLWLRDKTTHTDANGSFQFDGLVNTDYVLSATTHGPDGTTTVFRTKVSVKPHMPTKVVLQLQGSCSLRGSVQFQDVVGGSISVRAYHVADLSGGPRRKSKASGKNFRAWLKGGSFRLRGLPEGIYSLEVTHFVNGKRRVHKEPKEVIVRPGADNQVSIQVPPR